MAGARFDGTAAIEHLSGLVDAINDPSPLLAELGEYGLRSTRARFKTQTAPDGTAWTACGDLARGDENVARLRMERDVAEGVKEAAMQASWRRAADRKDIGRLIEWSARRDLAAGLDPEDAATGTVFGARRAA